MTVTYTSKVTTSRGLGIFFRLLGRWRGSIYKIVWADLLLYLGIYYALNITYLFLLDATCKKYFERGVTYCAKYGSLIPLSFVLGFFVNIVFTRWWNQYTSIPFPDNLAINIAANIKGENDRARMVRRTIVRYVCCTFTLTLSMLSPKVKKRFPTLNHFVQAGLMSPEEKQLMEQLDNDYPNYSKHWLPIAWAASVTTKARHEGIITEDLSSKGILDELNVFRGKCGRLLDYDWISIPLVYTQVVTLAVYSFFLMTVIGYQFIEHRNKSTAEIIIFSFPFMPVVEFFFYMGWLKVAETLINPFGEDDDDFEVMWMIDRHIQVCYLLVDKIHHKHPALGKDMYWEERVPTVLPFTVASQNYMQEHPEWSTGNMKVKSTDQDFIVAEYIAQVDPTDNENSLWSTFVRKRTGSRGMVLKYVTPHKVECSNVDEMYAYGEADPNKVDIPLNQPTVVQDSKEFEQLREERMKKQREKWLKCVEVLKSICGEGKIVDDIIK